MHSSIIYLGEIGCSYMVVDSDIQDVVLLGCPEICLIRPAAFPSILSSVLWPCTHEEGWRRAQILSLGLSSATPMSSDHVVPAFG